MKRIHLLSALIVLLTICSFSTALAGDYLNSAHGDSSAGVNRTGMDVGTGLGYAKGNCAHCHEQHGTIEGTEPAPAGGAPSNFLLYTDTNPTSQTTNFCFQCHQTGGSLQVSGITNNDYSTTFGGQGTPSTVSVDDAFNPTAGTAHDLTDVRTELVTSYSFAATDNPCGGCHNPHLALKNNSSGVAYNATYYTNSAISRPGDRDNLWGDAPAERMLAYATGLGGAYRAPFYVGANPAQPSTSHEPDGQSGAIGNPNVTGANTPDYSTFCLDCHSRAVTGTNPARPIPIIPWAAGNGQSQHGPAAAGGSTAGNRIPPYTVDGTDGTITGAPNGLEDLTVNFVLSCLDCHEPHGSNQANGQYLLRTTVNGTATAFTGSNAWYTFCTTCHVLTGGAPNHSAFGVNTATCNNAACHGHSVGQNF